MKKYLYALPALLLSGILLSSCATNRVQPVHQKAETAPSRETETGHFVKMKDGTIRHYQSIKLVTGVFKSPHLLADGKTRIEAKDIIAYQNDEHYAVSQNTFASGRKSYVAVETLPGFAIRIVKGKLNVYCKKFFNGRAAVDEYYLQSGDEGQIVAYHPDLMQQLISNNQEALSFFMNTKTKEKELAKKLEATAVKYNQTDALLSQNL